MVQVDPINSARETVMKINGFEVLMALPCLNGNGEITQYVILVDRAGPPDRYVTARVRTLDDAEWWAGAYYSDLDRAIASAHKRALDA
jgi:hypothetical protein